MDDPEEPLTLSAAAQRWGGAGRALALAGATLIVLLAGLAAGVGASKLFDALSGIGKAGAKPAGEMEALQTAAMAVFLLAFQATAILVTGALSRRLKPVFGDLLPAGVRVRAILGALAGFTLLLGVISAAILFIDRSALTEDARPFAGLMQSRSWWLMLIAAGAGAPVCEELLFRGLLFGGLKTTRLGGGGAALVSSMAWAGMHIQYTWPALGAIVAMGLYFCWLRVRTGSLVPGIVCHGVYNSLIVLALAFSPDQVLGAD